MEVPEELDGGGGGVTLHRASNGCKAQKLVYVSVFQMKQFYSSVNLFRQYEQCPNRTKKKKNYAPVVEILWGLEPVHSLGENQKLLCRTCPSYRPVCRCIIVA